MNLRMKYATAILLPIILGVCVLGFLLHEWHIPLKKTSILNGRDVSAIDHYKTEFADQLVIVSSNWTVETYGEAFIYLPDAGKRGAPNGKFTIGIERIPANSWIPAADYYELTILDDAGRKKDIITIEEADAGSGLSFHPVWSEDSKAVFIYGRGKPYGYDEYLQPVSLIYLVEENKIYTIDLKKELFNRLSQTNLSDKKTKSASKDPQGNSITK